MSECSCPAARGGTYPHSAELHEDVPDLWPLVQRMILESIGRETGWD